MKPKHLKWLKLTGEKIGARDVASVQIRNIPAVKRLEDQLLLYSSHRGSPPPGIEDNVSRELFGIVATDTFYELPKNYESLDELSEERYQIDLAFNRYESKFKAEHLSLDDTVEYLLSLGLDFRDEHGQPLRCIMLLRRQAEAAAKKIFGKLPDLAAGKSEAWAEALQRETELFIARKRGR
jgi:hypothetical protein